MCELFPHSEDCVHSGSPLLRIRLMQVCAIRTWEIRNFRLSSQTLEQPPIGVELIRVFSPIDFG